MKRSNLRYTFAGLAIIAGLLAGCAVLTVDVDVYKGPLANTEEIQGEQVISLVMGAKPLLIQLRDRLEASEPEVKRSVSGIAVWQAPSETEVQRRLRDLRSEPGYRAGYMQPLFWQPTKVLASNVLNGGLHKYNSELALRVNDVLGLYEDRLEPSIASTVKEAREWLNDYKLSYAIVEPTDNKESKTLWEKTLRPKLVSTDQNLIQAYTEFFSYQKGNPLVFRSDSKRFLEADFQSELRKAYASNEQTNEYGNRNPYPSFSYQLLKDRFVREDAEKLFGSDAANRVEAAKFEAEVIRVCQAFLDARKDIRALLRLGLFNLAQLKSVTELDDGTRLALIDELARGTAKLIHGPALFQAISGNSNNRNLQVLKQVLNLPFGGPSNKNNTINVLSQTNITFAQAEEAWNAAGSTAQKNEWREMLARILANSPSSLAVDLLRVDGDLADAAAAWVQPDKTGYVFGLGINPQQIKSDFNEDPSSENLFGRTLTKIAQKTGPLDGGRLSEGVETLISEYFQAAKKSKNFGDRLSIEQGQHLIAALTQFGQKTVSLGNFAPLMNSGNRDEIKRYISVLQGVGNSALVHIDELKQSARHDANLKKKSANVAQSFSEVARESLPNSMFARKAGETNKAEEPGTKSNPSDSFPKRWESTTFDAREAAEQLVLELRAEYIRLLRESDSPSDEELRLSLEASQPVDKASANLTRIEAQKTNSLSVEITQSNAATNVFKVQAANKQAALNRYREALEHAIEIRSGFIHLRPASSYLRSSYPTSILGKSTLTTGNMLSQQGLRQIPLLGALVDGVNNEDLKTYLEVDRQSWQNVNKVRVAGAGDVNYAIAKDDVGNWYVKAYETDPQRIFKSMRNMATFSMGSTFGQALPIRNSSTDQVMAFTNPVLQQQITVALTAYRKSTTNEFGRLYASLTSLPSELEARWTKDGISGKNLTDTKKAFTEVWEDQVTNVLGGGLEAWKTAVADKKSLPDLSDAAEPKVPALLEATLSAKSKAAAKLATLTLTNITASPSITTNVVTVTNVVATTNLTVVTNFTKVTNEVVVTVYTTRTNIIEKDGLSFTNIISVANPVSSTNITTLTNRTEVANIAFSTNTTSVVETSASTTTTAADSKLNTRVTTALNDLIVKALNQAIAARTKAFDDLQVALRVIKTGSESK